MYVEKIEHQLYLLSNEIADYNQKIKDCENEIKDNKDMKKDALSAVRELFKELRENQFDNLDGIEDIETKYSYLLNN